MNKQILSAVKGVLVAGVAFVVIAFFWKNPFRVGEVTITTPKGASMTFKVADSNEIFELIWKGLENERSMHSLTNALLSSIERLPPGSMLGKKLVDLVEQRRPPFSSSSVPVKLVYSPSVPRGLVAVCDHSGFLAKNIAVFVLRDDGELLSTFPVYADVKLTFPCPGGGEILRTSVPEVEDFKRHQVLAKRTF